MFNKGQPESINADLPIESQSELLPNDLSMEFPRDRLKLGYVFNYKSDRHFFFLIFSFSVQANSWESELLVEWLKERRLD